MATPEISHRCALCGASIRPGALACPNCGEAEARPSPLATIGEPQRPEPSVSRSWLMQPDLTPATMSAEEPRARETDEEAPILPPVYTPAPVLPEAPALRPGPPAQDVTEAPILEIPAPVLAEKAEPETGPVILEVPPVALPDAELTPEEKLALIKNSTPTVKVLDGPHQHRKRRRSRSLTLRERLAGRIRQLRDVSRGASRKVAPTVDQLRHTSNAVLDRASDDPSARFLLVGILLVGVAAFVFFVSFFMG